MVNTIVKVNNSYISCSCNRTPNSVDWGYNGLMCYGSCNAVAIYDPKNLNRKSARFMVVSKSAPELVKGYLLICKEMLPGVHRGGAVIDSVLAYSSRVSSLGSVRPSTACGGGKVLTTLTGHKDRVNAVKWIKKEIFTPESELVSVSSDNCGLVWSQCDDSYIVSDVLKGHESSVTVVDALYHPSSGSKLTLVVVTASVDSTVRIWKRQYQQAAVCCHVVSLDSGICLSLRLTLAHSASLLLACALDDCNIHLYSDEDGTINKKLVLKGHEDWISALDFTTEDGGDLLLASGCQDSTVRMWRFHPPRLAGSDQLLHVEEKTLSLGSVELAVSLESVLLGHDGRVYGVKWHPPMPTDKGQTQPLRLLTASLDKTVVLWAPEEQSGVWLEEARMGEVGGNTLGFYGACFGPSGTAILAHSYQGGFHIWNRCQESWRPGVVVGGHFDAVNDLGWETQHGRYVLTVSSDQTTRLHAPWVAANNDKDQSWHEIARPQVHGYDLVCLAMLPGFRFVSGADEKVVRAFAAPQNFLENFKRLCLKNSKDDENVDKNILLPTGAAIPVLGLSNKAVFQNEMDRQPEERHVKDQYDDNSYFTPQHLEEPPTEDNLLQNTLWPETMKLYGHGYEIFSLASTTDGKLLASACKATNEEHAAILLWDTSTWQKIDRLVSHQLTITQMQFSPDDRFLLSVSRDRRWSVFQKSDSESEMYRLIARTDKSTGIHTRIIWCCSWSHNSAHFATGSRDGKVVVWGGTGEDHPVLGQFSASSEYLDLPKESITSVAFGTGIVLSVEEYLVAVGSQVGDIRLYGWGRGVQTPWRFLYQLSGNCAHHLAVKKLAFRPVTGKAGQTQDSHSESDLSTNTIVQLASCGLDHTLKICDLHIQCNK